MRTADSLRSHAIQVKMATAARWSLRLARSSINPASSRIASRGAVKRLEQRRWLQQRRTPPPRRPWAQRRSEPNPPEENVSKARIPQEQNHSVGVPSQSAEQPGRNTQLATALAESDNPDLVAPVSIPDDPHTVLPKHHPALSILGNSSLVIQRQLEMMNVMLGFEQANRYIIMDGQGQTLGYIAEQDHGIGSAVKRQAFKTHRSFTTHIFDAREREVLRIHRPFAWINSRIRIYDPVPPEGYGEDADPGKGLQETGIHAVVQQSPGAKVSPLKLEEMRVIGEATQQWAPLRRKYNLFAFRPFEDGEGMLTLHSGQRLSQGNKSSGSGSVSVTEATTGDETIEKGMVQFANINEPFLSWDFSLRDQSSGLVGSVNRNFSGFAREIFTDTGVYALRMDSAAQQGSLQDADGRDVRRYEREATGMALDQRAVMLATAVSIDFDYFSRHSGHGSGGFMPFFWPVGGAGAEAGGAGAAGAGAAEAGAVGAGAAEAGAVGAEGAAGAVGAAGRGAAGLGSTAAESGMVGAGTMAGYEAMQRGVYGRGGGGDDASPQAPPPQPNDPYSAGGADGGQGMEGQNQPGNDVWGEDQDPWGGGGSGPPAGGAGEGGSGGGGEGGGGGLFDALSDFFGGD